MSWEAEKKATAIAKIASPVGAASGVKPAMHSNDTATNICVTNNQPFRRPILKGTNRSMIGAHKNLKL